MITRACTAILNWNKTKILMVKHQEKDRVYWTLPGGGIEKNETPEECAIREVNEEANIYIRIKNKLFEDTYIDNGIVRKYVCFLGSKKVLSHIKLGSDPEEKNINEDLKMLKDIKGKCIQEMKEDIQISQVIKILNLRVSKK